MTEQEEKEWMNLGRIARAIRRHVNDGVPREKIFKLFLDAYKSTPEMSKDPDDVEWFKKFIGFVIEDGEIFDHVTFADEGK